MVNVTPVCVRQIHPLFFGPILSILPLVLITPVSHSRRPADSERLCSLALSGIPVRDAV
jgi:hypothetical protein